MKWIDRKTDTMSQFGSMANTAAFEFRKYISNMKEGGRGKVPYYQKERRRSKVERKQSGRGGSVRRKSSHGTGRYQARG